MKNNLLKIGFMSIAILLVVFWLLDSRNDKAVQSAITQTIPAQETGIHSLTGFNEDSFYQGVARAKPEYQKLRESVNGGIIPHHSFAGYIIADFFQRLVDQEPSTIILIGPNHFERGDFVALTSLYDWETSFGEVGADREIIGSLLQEGLVMIDESVLDAEHSVSTIMPFIKFYLPNVQVVPIILSGGMTLTQVEIFAESLAALKTPDIIIVSAVDFSHNLINQEAQLKDVETLEVMQARDYKRLFSFGNEHLDSPASIAALMLAMDSLDSPDIEILQHTNSGELQDSEQKETTSYFSIVFY